jgi:hypothetical protein
MEKSQCFGQTRTIGRIWLLLAVSLLWHSGANATDYYWESSGNKYPDAYAACESRLAQYDATEVTRVDFSSDYKSAACFAKRGSNNSYGLGIVYRRGDSCPVDHTFNQTTGACDPPEQDPCLPTTGAKIGHRHKLGEIALGTIATTPPPPIVCHESCRYSDPEKDGDPYRFLSNSPTGAWLNFSYFGDGDSCEAGDAEADAPSDNKPVSDKENKCTNKVCLTVDESGNCQQYSYSCTATEKFTDPGKMDCDFGDFNGSSVCVPNSPAPKMTEKEVKTEVKETTNSDGSKDTETTTTTNTTTCSGVGSCSTTTTTNVSNNKTNPDGSDGGSSSTCTGADCKTSDGKSQNEAKEEEQSESKVTGGTTCEAPPVCTGDAIQCAILRQTYTQRCADEKFQEVDGEKLVAEVGSGFEGSEFKPFGEGEKGTFDLSNMIDTSSTIGGSCPALPPITFTFRGVTQRVEFGTVMAELCKYAGWFSYLMVAFAMRRAAEIVAGGMA